MKRRSCWKACLLVTIPLLGLGCTSSGPQAVADTPGWADPLQAQAGQKAAQRYTAGELKDYEVVWMLYDLDPNERSVFLNGFTRGLTQADDRGRRAVATVLQGAISGNQFRTALDLGSKHAAGTITNEQIQGAIRSSRNVSEAVSLGWKAGYIRGFSAQEISQTAARAFVNEEIIAKLQRRAAATYNALRAATGR